MKNSFKQILNSFLENLGLAKNQKHLKWQKWYENQIALLNEGKEIQPPWIAFPDSEPFGWNQGYQEEWKSNVWMPFWGNLIIDEKKSYLKKWQPPTTEWKEFYSDYL
jgi:hypothetical protein